MDTPPMTMGKIDGGGAGAVHGEGQQHGGHHGHDVGLVKVGGHTGAVTHVVAHVGRR